MAKDLGPYLDELATDYVTAAAKGKRYAETMAEAFNQEGLFKFNDVDNPLLLARTAAAEMHAIDRALRAWIHLRDRTPDGAIADHPQAGDLWTTTYAVDISALAEHPIDNAPALRAMYDRLDWLGGLDFAENRKLRGL